MKLREFVREAWAWTVILLLLLGCALVATVWVFLAIHL